MPKSRHIVVLGGVGMKLTTVACAATGKGKTRYRKTKLRQGQREHGRQIFHATDNVFGETHLKKKEPKNTFWERPLKWKIYPWLIER